jgi:hypothetical protein
VSFIAPWCRGIAHVLVRCRRFRSSAEGRCIGILAHCKCSRARDTGVVVGTGAGAPSYHDKANNLPLLGRISGPSLARSSARAQAGARGGARVAAPGGAGAGSGANWNLSAATRQWSAGGNADCILFLRLNRPITPFPSARGGSGLRM